MAPESILNYGPRQRLGWVARHRGLLIALSFVIAIAAPTCWYWKPLRQYALWQYWSYRAATFLMPTEPVDLIIHDPLEAKRIASTNPSYKIAAMPGYASYIPPVYEGLNNVDSRLGLLGGKGEPIAFIGAMRRPDGVKRLVIVDGKGGFTGNVVAFTSAIVLPLPNWTDSPPPPGIPLAARILTYSGPPPTETIFKSGVLDPKDPSHIVFNFEAGLVGGGLVISADQSQITQSPWQVSGRGVIDANLQDDDSITFKVRNFSGSDLNLQKRVSSVVGDVQTLQSAHTFWGPPSKSSGATLNRSTSRSGKN